MTHPARLFSALLLPLTLLTSLATAQDKPYTAPPKPAPVKLILDTDMGNDVDDALALGMIHALISRDDCELLAVTLSKDNHLAAEYVDAVNTFYGRPDIPIGMVRSGKTKEDGRFLKIARTKDDGKLRYPHDLTAQTEVPDATKLLRETLAAQPDGSVVIAQIGFSTNLARLLDSPADDISPLTGRELIKQKVKLLSAMAGSFDEAHAQRRYAEYNVKVDIPSAKKVFSEWPGPVVMSGFEIGIAIPYPANSIEQDYDYVPHHPLRESYVLYTPPPHNRPTWDLTSVLYGVFPGQNYFGLSAPGIVKVADDGFTTFTEQPTGNARYMTLTPEQITRVTETFIWLASEPPSSR